MKRIECLVDGLSDCYYCYYYPYQLVRHDGAWPGREKKYGDGWRAIHSGNKEASKLSASTTMRICGGDAIGNSQLMIRLL